MKDLVLKFLFKADSSDVKKQIKGVEAQGKKAAEGIGSSLKKAFVGLGSAIAGIGLSRVFKGAIDDAAALEQSLLKLRAAAKNTGQDFGTIEKGLQRLRSEGTLSFQTITEASQQLLQQGFQADDIEPFLRALRNIGALENTVGDTNEAMKSFIRAISTNSIELVDNLSPALRKTVLELGGFNEIAKNADKQQQFLNITLDRGAQFAEAYGESIETVAGKQGQLNVETEKLSEAFGQALAPAFEETLDVLTPMVQGMTDFLSSLGPTGKSVLAAGAAAVTAAAGFSAMAFAIGATASAATILTGGLIVIGSAIAAASLSQAGFNEEVNRSREIVEDLTEKLKKLEGVRGVDREREILTRKLASAQKTYNRTLDDRILKENALLKIAEASNEQARKAAARQRAQAARTLLTADVFRGQRNLTPAEVQAIQSGDTKAIRGIREGLFGRGKSPFSPSIKETIRLSAAFESLLEAQAAIQELGTKSKESAEAQRAMGAAMEGAAGGAGKFNSELDKTDKKLKTLKFDVTPLDRYASALIDIENQVNSSATTEETFNAARLARQAALTDAIDETTGNIENMTDAVETLKDESASAADKLSALGTGLRGFGQTLGDLFGSSGVASAFGTAGATVGLVGGIAGLFSSIFSSSEETNDTLDRQLELQRQQYDLQKQQAGIEKKYFEDDLEIIRQRARLEGRDPNQEIASAISTELARLGFAGGISIESLEQQRETIKQVSEQRLRKEDLLSQAQRVQGLQGRGISQDITNINEINRIRREAGLSAMTGRLSDVINQTIVDLTAQVNQASVGTQERIQELLEQGISVLPAPAPAPSEAEKIREDIATREAELQELIIEQNRGIDRLSEIQTAEAEIDRLRALLTLPAPAPAPAAAAPQLAQAQGRGFGLIDISRGGLQTATGFSVTRGASLAAQAGVPGSIGSLTVATEAMKTTEDKMLDTLNNQLSELKKQTDLLASMTGQDVTMAVLNAMADAETRTI